MKCLTVNSEMYFKRNICQIVIYYSRYFQQEALCECFTILANNSIGPSLTPVTLSSFYSS